MTIPLWIFLPVYLAAMLICWYVLTSAHLRMHGRLDAPGWMFGLAAAIWPVTFIMIVIGSCHAAYKDLKK